MNFEVPEDVAVIVEKWTKRHRAIFDELLEDAQSELEAELVCRSILAGHTPNEVHAFGDEIRGKTDDELFDTCTLDPSNALGYTVAQLLRAEADPLYAFELNGNTLSPAEDEVSEVSAPAATAPAPAAPPKTSTRLMEAVSFQGDVVALAKAAANVKGFNAESIDARPVARPKAPMWEETTASGKTNVGTGTAQQYALDRPSIGKLMEDVLAEATRPLGVTWREHEVDVDGGMTLETAINGAVGPIARGTPIPIAIGPKPGTSRRFVLLLQLSTSGKSRAWQLFDPLSQELVWANEGDLLARTELPFADKRNRRVTRIALPSGRTLGF